MSRLHLQSPESTPPSPSSSAVKRRQRGCVPHQRTCPPARPRRGDDGRDGGLRERRRGGVARVAGRVRPPARSPGQARLRGRGLLPPQPPRTPARPRPGPLHRQARAGRLLQWKLSRGKWRPRLMDFVKGLDGEVVVSASRKAFAALPDLSRAITELTVLKGIGPATVSTVLAAYAPDVAPFMSDEAMVAALGNAKEYTLKQYLAFADKLQATAKELMVGEESFTPSDVERALWSSAIGSKSPADGNLKSDSKTRGKRKR